MGKKKVLIVSQEMKPYTTVSNISDIAFELPQYVQDNGMEIRVLMPRFGVINERRHRLHEVVRLSGMNIIVDDDDYPLIIKVASLPGSRMQVYFLDNEDFFRRKYMFEDEDGKPFDDNADRMAFFCKGVLETVKKFGWPPDIVHCHGWMTSLIPLYLKTAYKTEPLFQNTKVIYSIYQEPLPLDSASFLSKASINNLTNEDLSAYVQDGHIALHEGAIHFADGLIKGSDDLQESVVTALSGIRKPYLEFYNQEQYLETYLDFYQQVLGEK